MGFYGPFLCYGNRAWLLMIPSGLLMQEIIFYWTFIYLHLFFAEQGLGLNHGRVFAVLFCAERFWEYSSSCSLPSIDVGLWSWWWCWPESRLSFVLCYNTSKKKRGARRSTHKSCWVGGSLSTREPAQDLVGGLWLAVTVAVFDATQNILFLWSH